jgi:histone H3
LVNLAFAAFAYDAVNAASHCSEVCYISTSLLWLIVCFCACLFVCLIVTHQYWHIISDMAKVKHPASATNASKSSQFARQLAAKRIQAVVRKPRRLRPGTAALREIRRYQRSTHNIIPKSAFARLVRETVQVLASPDIRLSRASLEVLQVGMDVYYCSILTLLFQTNANSACRSLPKIIW